MACREYTLPRDDQSSQPKGWIQGNTRIGPVLEVATSFQHFKYGIEIRIESLNQDDSHSWVRISYGTVKYVIDSIEDNTENPADSQEEESIQTSSSVVAARSKAKAKPQPRDTTGITTIPLRERRWIDIEPSKARSRIVRSLEESHQSSSTQSGVTSRRRWSNSILQNKIPSPRSRLARYMHRAWKRHQDAVFWVDIDLGIKEGLVFYQTRSNAIILQGTPIVL